MAYAVWLDYYNDGKYGGFVCEEPTGHGSTFRTTNPDRDVATLFSTRRGAELELVAIKHDIWLLNYPNAKLSVRRISTGGDG